MASGWKIVGLVCLACVACTRTAALKRPEPPRSGPSWDGFVAAYIEGYLPLHPAFAVAQGRHEYDGLLPDWSQAAFEREIAWLSEAARQARAFAPEVLSPIQRFQRAYVIAQIDAELFWLRDARLPFANPSYYFDAGLDPTIYVTLAYAPLDQRMRAFIRYARAIPEALEHVRANLAAPMPRTFVDYAVAGFHGFSEFYEQEVPAIFADVKDPALQAELSAVLAPAAAAMRELGDLFAARTEFADAAFVLGPERFAAMLRDTEAVTTPVAELETIGKADLERNLVALGQACAAFAPNESLHVCVDRQSADKPIGGAVEGARAQLDDLQHFIVERALVSIPPAQGVRVEKAPAYRRQNFAYIEIPGAYEKSLPSTYYIAPPDPAWSKAERDAYVPGQADLLFTSIHEVWPGHFLQYLHSNASPWRFGQLFVGYAFSEGWAHYAEELMLESGIAEGQPVRRVGQALNALLRDVRFVCAIGLHTQGMTVAKCEQLFKDNAFQDPGNARQQAARGTYDPAYLNYTLGKLMIRKLRADWQRENAGHSLREFHDALLSYGGPPLPLLRGQLLRNPGEHSL